MKKNLFINVSALLALVFVFAGSAASQTNYEKAFKGYTLFTTLMSNTTYLINMDGDIVHTWQLSSSSAFSTYFLENGHIFRAASRGGGGGMGGFGNRGGVGGVSPSNRGQDANETRVDGRGQGGSPQMQRRGGPGGGGVGAGGKIQEVDWDGNLVWDFEYYTDKEVPHHDITKMPNGNVLIVCWDDKTDEENIAAGRNPEYQTAALPPDCIIEVKPTGKTTGEVVWKWYVWDHLIQDFDPNKPNYGKVAEHPELIDINYSESWADQPAPGAGQANRGTGGFAGGRGGFGGGMGGGMMGGGGRIPTTDWTHFNAVAYNAELDQIVLCSYTFSEFWIIDHSTTTAEAASHKGGKCGKGGDLLYRWGNPAAYKSGTEADQKLFCPHNAHWIDKGLPGAGHLLIFNNGPNRQDGRYSSVDELVLPMDEKGNYKMEGKTFGPKEPVWSYIDPNDKTNFYATNISGAQRLPNGNTLICVGPSGRFFEVTSDKEIVWNYRYSSGEGASENMINGIDVGSMIFRAYRIPANHPGLKGKELKSKNN